MKRLLLILPIALFAILHYQTFNPDEQVYGLVHFGQKGLFIFLFLIALTTSCFALLMPQHPRKIKYEILLFTIFSISILTIIYTLTLRGHTSGKSCLVAENDSSSTDLKTLTLKENGNFTLSLSAVDFGVDYSGEYIRRGDTLFLDQEVIDKTDEQIASIYMIQDSTLKPIANASQFISFKVKNKN